MNMYHITNMEINELLHDLFKICSENRIDIEMNILQEDIDLIYEKKENRVTINVCNPMKKTDIDKLEIKINELKNLIN